MIAVVGMIASRTGAQSSSKLLKTEAIGADYLDVSNGSTQWGLFFRQFKIGNYNPWILSWRIYMLLRCTRFKRIR